MEKQLFDYPGQCDYITDMGFQFYDITLKVDVGNFNKGEKFPEAFLDFDNGILALFRGGKEWKFKLTLGVGDEICV